MREIPPGEIGDFAEELITKLLQTTVLESDARLKVGTPVDTGRLRAGWQIGEDMTPQGVPVEGEFGDKGSAKMITSPSANALRVVRTGPKGANYTPGKEKVDSVYTIANNLEYAEPICYGTGRPDSWVKSGTTGSKQNPPPWVEEIAKSMQKYIDYNWDKITKRN